MPETGSNGHRIEIDEMVTSFIDERTSWLLPGWDVILDNQPAVEVDDLVDEPEAPADPPAQEIQPWAPQISDVVTVTESDGNVYAGEVAIIDGASRLSGCGDPHCTDCSRISLQVARVTTGRDSTDMIHSYVRTAVSNLAPMVPESGEYCRCQNAAHRGGGARVHRNTGACVAPVRVLSDYDNEFTIMEGAARIVFADRLATRQAERQALLDRVGQMHAGQRYLIDNPGTSYYGHIARVRNTPRSHDLNILVDIEDSEGNMIRSSYRVDGTQLGSRFHSWQSANRAPGFIQFASPCYSGAVTVSDREVEDSGDEHECDHACFDYGCSANPPGGGRLIHWNDSYDHDDDDDHDDEEGRAGHIPIMSYSYRPNLIFSGEGPVYLGTELELSHGSSNRGRRAMAESAKILTESAIAPYVFLKGDGSISGHGYEAVFHPMSYDWVIENWPEDLLRRMRQAGAMPHSSCGMHVHVSRSGFSSPVHAYKWIKFMYRNAREMSRMARRDPSQWATFGSPVERSAAKWHAKGGYGGQNRYVAVNAMPTDTYEVRIFASTLNRRRFLGSLGLVDASVEYTRQLTTQEILGGNGWTFDPFREYVSSFEKYAPVAKEFERLLG